MEQVIPGRSFILKLSVEYGAMFDDCTSVHLFLNQRHDPDLDLPNLQFWVWTME